MPIKKMCLAWGSIALLEEVPDNIIASIIQHDCVSECALKDRFLIHWFLLDLYMC